MKFRPQAHAIDRSLPFQEILATPCCLFVSTISDSLTVVRRSRKPRQCLFSRGALSSHTGQQHSPDNREGSPQNESPPLRRSQESILQMTAVTSVVVFPQCSTNTLPF